MKEFPGRAAIHAMSLRLIGAVVACVVGASVGCSPDEEANFNAASNDTGGASGTGNDAGAIGSGGAGGADDTTDGANGSGGTSGATASLNTSTTSGAASDVGGSGSGGARANLAASGASTSSGGSGSDASEASVGGSRTMTNSASSTGRSNTSDAGSSSSSTSSTGGGTASPTAGGSNSSTAGGADSTTTGDGGQGGSQASTSTDGTTDVGCATVDLGEALGDPVYAEYVSHDGERNDMRVAMDCNGGPPWVTFAWTAPAAGAYRFSTLGSDYDTALFVLPACGAEVTQCSDDTPTSITSATELTLTAGELVILDVGVFDAALGSDVTPHLVLNISEAD